MSAMSEKSVRNFCIQQPRPARLVVKNEDDDVQEIAPPDGRGITWANTARSILALKPVLIEAYDAEGKLLRATRGEEEEKPLPGTGLSPIHTDPETARLTHFANLLYRATEFSTTLAFTKMVELFELSQVRSERIEARLERAEATYRKAMQDRIDEAFDQAEELREQAKEASQGDPASDIVKAFIGGAANGAAEKHP